MMAPSAPRPNYTASSAQPNIAPTAAAAKPKTGASTFDDLWTSSLSTVSTSGVEAGAGAQGKKSLNEMGQQKSVDQLWGTSGSGAGQFGSGGMSSGSQKQGGGDLDDLLL